MATSLNSSFQVNTQRIRARGVIWRAAGSGKSFRTRRQASMGHCEWWQDKGFDSCGRHESVVLEDFQGEMHIGTLLTLIDSSDRRIPF